MSCHHVGVLFTSEDVFDRRSPDAYAKACEAGVIPSCFALAEIIPVAPPKYDGAWGKRARLLERACDGDHAEACQRLGLRAKACKLSHAQSCHELASTLLETDPNRLALLERACSLELQVACVDVAEHHVRRTPEAAAEVVEQLEKACEANLAKGCALLAVVHDTKDHGRAAPLHLRACDGGYVAACYPAGVALKSGQGVAKDGARAHALFIESCPASGPGCLEAADAEKAGTFGTKNPELAVDLYARGCLRHNEPRACLKGAELQLSIARRIPDEALKSQEIYHACGLYEHACLRAGVEDACDRPYRICGGDWAGYFGPKWN